MKTHLQTLLTRKPLLYLLIAVNLYGAVYGYWWYRRQFAQTPLYLWLFVPNSPLPVTYFLVVLVLFLRRRRSPFWEGLACFGLIKHGLWTVAIISVYHFTGRIYPENIFLWTGHLGMALQALLFWYAFGLHLSLPLAAGISGWYLFNDYLDYGVGIHPAVDTAAISLAAVAAMSLIYSAILTIAYIISARKTQKRSRYGKGNT